MCLCSLLHPLTAGFLYNGLYITNLICYFRCYRFVERWSKITLLYPLILILFCETAFIPSWTDSTKRHWWNRMTLSHLVVKIFACVVSQLVISLVRPVSWLWHMPLRFFLNGSGWAVTTFTWWQLDAHFWKWTWIWLARPPRTPQHSKIFPVTFSEL